MRGSGGSSEISEWGKLLGDDSIPAEFINYGGDAVISALTIICNKIWATGEWPSPWTKYDHHTTQERKSPDM